MPDLPSFPGLTWRPPAATDAPGLASLAAACAAVDAAPAPPGLAAWAGRLAQAAPEATAGLVGLGPDGSMVAYGWLAGDDHLVHEYRVFLEGGVHPAWRGRGLGGDLFDWLEARGRALAAANAAGRPVVLRIDTYDTQNPAAAGLYAAHGFRLALVEDDMRRELGPAAPTLPRADFPPGSRLEPWTPGRATAFYFTYVAAFRGRPGFPGWSLDQWHAAFTGQAGFRADLSRLLLLDEEPVAYTLCSVQAGEGEGAAAEGWIEQMGVAPAWRGRGLAAGLLAQALADFQAEGLACAMLSVNANNPAAAALYCRLGFVTARRLSSYRKRG